MRTRCYVSVLTLFFAWSCSSMQTMSTSIEDDIYYAPNKKPLMVKEVESVTGQNIDMYAQANRESYSERYPEDNSAVVINRQRVRTEQISTSELAAHAESVLLDPMSAQTTILYENTGYWIGGFNGTNSDLQEAARIISQYPEGFGFVANGQDIAMNLSFSPEWNVYTDNGRYWWFPTSSNVQLYNTFLFGTYPKYIWTVVWNEPFYDSWAFDSHFNVGLSFGWSRPGWSFGFGWNSGFYRPWYDGWYGYSPYWNNWNRPWWGSHYYPHWHHPHPYYPHYAGHHPNWAPPANNRPNRPGNLRPSYGNSSVGLRPGVNRPGNTTRPDYNNSRPGSNVHPGSQTTRPNNTTVTRPNYNNGRPGTGTVRPNTQTVRPGTTRPTNSNSRPTVTRPNSSTTGSTNNASRYTRPATTNNKAATNQNGNIKTYQRPTTNTRPTYNNSSSGNNGTNSFYNRNSTRSYNQSRSTYSAPKVYSPSNSGGSRATTPARTTNRSGGRR
ncbi:hypothetical protein [Odoribacter lunatus]|uniref:hypothetical protein n=1 Tax=Odoribacter lunatus TaxID=2941335 RepID=UPI00203D272F|nr:hypothetical protein [Odoribacter lunatus]